ncbi:MAG: RNA methyltransferase [Bacteroidia bacterium]|nr:RNA methyltransferase [Bacteroidia bacterium]
MKKLSVSELCRLSLGEYKSAPKASIVVVLDNVRSAFNVGSIFRTCDAFRVEAIYLCGMTARPPHKDIHKTALGATESVEWHYFPKTIEAITSLKQKKYKIVAIEQTDCSIPLNKFTINSSDKIALVFGHEVNGIAQEILDLCDIAVEIPQFGTKHSFNIIVSAGIVLWKLFIRNFKK